MAKLLVEAVAMGEMSAEGVLEFDSHSGRGMPGVNSSCGKADANRIIALAAKTRNIRIVRLMSAVIPEPFHHNRVGAAPRRAYSVASQTHCEYSTEGD